MQQEATNETTQTTNYRLVRVCVLGIAVCVIFGARYAHVLMPDTENWVAYTIGGLLGFVVGALWTGTFFTLTEIADNTKRQADNDGLVVRPDVQPRWRASN